MIDVLLTKPGPTGLPAPLQQCRSVSEQLHVIVEAWHAAWRADRQLHQQQSGVAAGPDGRPKGWRWRFETIQLACGVRGLELMESAESYALKLTAHKGRNLHLKLLCRRAAGGGKPPGATHSIMVLSILSGRNATATGKRCGGRHPCTDYFQRLNRCHALSCGMLMDELACKQT